MKHKSVPIKVSINKDYQDILDFYTKEHSLSGLFNVLLDECSRNKPFKFKILKDLGKIPNKSKSKV